MNLLFSLSKRSARRGLLILGYLVAGVAGLQAQWDVPEGLYLGPLRTWLRSNTYVGSFDDLGYNEAREQMFGLTDNNNGTVTCVYTGFSQPAAFTTYLNPINTEHIVPQSFFGGISPMRSDLYNMLPCHSSANSARNNSQYGEVGDATAQWYGISGSGTYVSQGNIPANPDAWSERSGEVWEPRESQKGNVARMVFYFYTMYPDAAGAITQMGSTATLYQWHLADPPDAAEVLRNTRVASVQGNRNPYVDMPELVYLAWMYNGTPVLGCTQVNACNYLPAATQDDGSCIFPSPGADCDGNTASVCNLFISEYAEGTSNNKYLELYNPTLTAIPLAGYAWAYVTNGPTTAGVPEGWLNFPTGAVLAPGDFFVVAHPQASATILAAADLTSTAVSNGDDGWALVQGTQSAFTVVDMVGDFLADPGDGWSVAGVTNATKDYTLVRKSGVSQGNAGNWTASAGTSTANSEWILRPMDDWSDLHQHTTTAVCGALCDDLNGNNICDDAEEPEPPTTGCTYPNACNYVSSATVDDGSCDFFSCVVEGCTYPEATNYETAATYDDGSCFFPTGPEADCVGDLNGDALVTTGDLLIFLSVFGVACPE